MISIIVPIYNVEKYLKKCVDSIIDQDFSNYEIILVDDGSTDRSLLIANEYMEKYPDFITTIHKENGGLGDARNVGIEKAQGDYLLFLDSDDYLEAGVLQQLCQNTLKTDADMFIFGFTIIRNGQILRRERDDFSINVSLNMIDTPRILLSFPSACNKLIKRDAFIHTGIRFPTKVWYEDIRTITKIYCYCNRIVYLNIFPYHYVLREGSITNNQNSMRNLEIIDAFEDILSFYKQYGYYDKYKNELEYLAIYHLLIAASVRIIRIDSKSSLLGKLWEYMINIFPDYKHNIYIKELSLNKKIVLYLIEKRRYELVDFIFKCKSKITNNIE